MSSTLQQGETNDARGGGGGGDELFVYCQNEMFQSSWDLSSNRWAFNQRKSFLPNFKNLAAYCTSQLRDRAKRAHRPQVRFNSVNEKLF